MDLKKSYVDSLAPSGDAIKNGQALADKKKFTSLCQAADDTLLFGECAGSGKNPYIVSVDFINPATPVFRCSCPSRQFPCKHALGLMYAFTNGSSFTAADIPPDIVAKRDKQEKRTEKKEQSKAASVEKTGPTKAQVTAMKKKIATQLDGIDLAEKILTSIVIMGLAAIDAKTRKMLEDQIKQLGNYYIGGVQTALYDVFIAHDQDNDDSHKTIEQITYAYALIKKSRDYLTNKKDDPVEALDATSDMEEQIGYAWKLEELKSHGLREENAQLVQLGFYSYTHYARKEIVDEGYWLSLGTGKLYKTKNYRPFKAAKYIKEEDSFFGVLCTEELIIYPGGQNPRVRWHGFTQRDLTAGDFTAIQSAATGHYAELLKTVKTAIKSPLANKHPLALVRFAPGQLTKAGHYIIAADSAGHKLTLGDISSFTEPFYAIFANTLAYVGQEAVMLVMFENNLDFVVARPISIVTDKKIIRLLY